MNKKFINIQQIFGGGITNWIHFRATLKQKKIWFSKKEQEKHKKKDSFLFLKLSDKIHSNRIQKASF